MITVDIVITCDNCEDAVIVEHTGLAIGERAPAIQMPTGWNGVDTGTTRCPKCSTEPVESPEHVQVLDREGKVVGTILPPDAPKLPRRKETVLDPV